LLILIALTIKFFFVVNDTGQGAKVQFSGAQLCGLQIVKDPQRGFVVLILLLFKKLCVAKKIGG
jgi:hypothetical protein